MIYTHEIVCQKELDHLLSLDEEVLKYSIIELVGKYALERIPYSNIHFMRSRSLDKPSPIIELGDIDCPEYINFFGTILLGGKLNLSNFSFIKDCNIKDVTINKGSLRMCYLANSKIDVMSRIEYDDLGGRYLPILDSCWMEGCTIDKANIYHEEYSGFNRLESVEAINLPPLQEQQHTPTTKILRGNNVIS